MQRRREILPDETGTVTLEALIDALARLAVTLDFAGGAAYIALQRAPTGLPGEMITSRVIIEWRDRTDAKEQPEPTTVLPEPSEADAPGGAIIDEQPGPTGEPDGFDYSKLQDEDVEEPQPAR